MRAKEFLLEYVNSKIYRKYNIDSIETEEIRILLEEEPYNVLRCVIDFDNKNLIVTSNEITHTDIVQNENKGLNTYNLSSKIMFGYFQFYIRNKQDYLSKIHDRLKIELSLYSYDSPTYDPERIQMAKNFADQYGFEINSVKQVTNRIRNIVSEFNNT